MVTRMGGPPEPAPNDSAESQAAWFREIRKQALRAGFEPVGMFHSLHLAIRLHEQREAREAERATLEDFARRALADHSTLHDLADEPRCANPLVECTADYEWSAEHRGMATTLVLHARYCRMVRLWADHASDPLRLTREYARHAQFIYDLRRRADLSLRAIAFLLACQAIRELPVPEERLRSELANVQLAYDQHKRIACSRARHQRQLGLARRGLRRA
jgi:hypothetical protein